MVKENNKYIYVRGSRHTDHGSRVYDIAGEQLPSVTTILSRTKDQRKLNEWKAKVGEQRAEEIKNLSSRRGTAMHKFIEAYLLQKGYEDLTDLGIQAKSMAEKII